MSANWIPMLLALATVVSIGASLVLGRAYDAFGVGTIVAGVCLASIFSPPPQRLFSLF